MRLQSGLLPSENLNEQRRLAEKLATPGSGVSDMARTLAVLTLEYLDYRGWGVPTFPIAEDATRQEQRHRRDYRAVWTGETRMPRAGEWFLSGAIIEAYCAEADYGREYRIARLVKAVPIEP